MVRLDFEFTVALRERRKSRSSAVRLAETATISYKDDFKTRRCFAKSVPTKNAGISSEESMKSS